MFVLYCGNFAGQLIIAVALLPLNSFSFIDVVGRVLFLYLIHVLVALAVMNLIYFKVMVFHIHHCRKAYVKTRLNNN